MSLLSQTIDIAERLPLPDGMTLAGIDWLVGRTRARLWTQDQTNSAQFAKDMQNYPIAIHTQDANAQHYELPERFFGLTLGPKRKYSCAYYRNKETSLAEAEIHGLQLTCEHAGLEDGQTILELGCGWGSLSLFMAILYPNAKITSVSNSKSQRAYIMGEVKRYGLNNLEVITADMNDFTTEGQFDRIVSVEMFEHMANWRGLLERAHGWLKSDGRLFLHVFTHVTTPYRFDHTDPADWIAKYYFTGGIMPSHDLPAQFADLFTVEQDWRWSGHHYQATAMDWLRNFDNNSQEIDAILRSVYGKDYGLWRRRWRLFFLATAGLFGHDKGDQWGVGHYRLKKSTT